jgi:magnesium chelatase accessory protein
VSDSIPLANARIVTAAGIDWHVEQQGKGPVLLLLHGTGGSTHSWARCVPKLARHYHVVSVDLPGHGRTVVPKHVEQSRNVFSLTGMGRVLGALLDAMQLTPAVAAGHSAGAAVLLRMCIDGTISPARLVGVCAALVAPPAWYVTLIAPLLGAVLETDLVADGGAQLAAGTRLVEHMLQSTGSQLTPHQLAHYRRLCENPAHVHAALTMMARWDLPALMRDVHALQTPVRIIAARGDRWIPLGPLSRAVQRIPRAELVVEEGGHLLMEERPEVVIREIER